ncbi:hypothetical protein J1782_07010 [Rahnella sp. BCC 1045]|uniref:hypothetical protein n=1 Tax=Rahnella sp. BCC 1045 TaxID=2816251 RepID=UPI001C280632|nr:hypothetical protein [Rahnella sp. BCC 1045]MBU9819634.1 hypothetical protein [Rahnella sp. BCC 1045]
MAGTYTINFTNDSDVSFDRSLYGLYRVDRENPEKSFKCKNLLISSTKSPNKVLMAEVGSQSVSVETNDLTSLIADGGYKDILCVWRNRITGERFGISIHAPLQVFTVGTAPYYLVMSDTTSEANPDSEPLWQTTGMDPSEQYTWANFAGISITATPTARHQDMSIEVLITNSQNVNKVC